MNIPEDKMSHIEKDIEAADQMIPEQIMENMAHAVKPLGGI